MWIEKLHYCAEIVITTHYGDSKVIPNFDTVRRSTIGVSAGNKQERSGFS